jgi:hypothetical protein
MVRALDVSDALAMVQACGSSEHQINRTNPANGFSGRCLFARLALSPSRQST